MLRRASTVAALTLASRLLGFARDAAAAALFGAGAVGDAAVAGLAVPQLARRLLSEGALNGAIVPALAEVARTEGDDAARRRAGAVLAALVLASGALALAMFAAMPAVIALLAPGFDMDGPRAEAASLVGRIAMVCLPLMAAAGALSAFANAGGRVGLPAVAPVAGNVAVLAVLGLCFLFPGAGLALLALASVAGAVAQLAIMLAALRGTRFAPVRAGGRVRIRALVEVWPMLATAGPSLLSAALPQLRFLIAGAAASGVLGGVAALFYAGRLIELPLGLVGASAGAVLLPALSAAGREARALASARGIEAALALTVPAALGLAVLAEPIVTVLFRHGAFDAQAAEATAGVLGLLAVALPAQAAEKILAAIAFAHGFGRFAAVVGLAALAVGAAVGFGLAGPLGLAGPVLGLVVSSFAGVTALAVGLGRRGLLRLDAPAWHRLPRLGVAAAAMALGTALAARALEAPLAAGGFAGFFALGAAVAAGLALYVGIAVALGGLNVEALKAGLRG
ncbi:MAG TPA: lipid II flippase MurJ [Xanthobacteraceae bacterium]|nr:lipid II flippase MurJ [Xanthobacteraceae bacterium]